MAEAPASAFRLLNGPFAYTVVIFICKQNRDKVLYFKSACRGRELGFSEHIS